MRAYLQANGGSRRLTDEETEVCTADMTGLQIILIIIEIFAKAKIYLFLFCRRQIIILAKFTEEELKAVFITSGAFVSSETAPEGAYVPEEGKIAVLVENADGERCDRCWCYSTEGEKTEEGFICARCKKILESL